jgi:uncharacterized membrane protein
MENNFEPTVSHLIHLVGVCIEIFGVFIIVVGIIWSTFVFLHHTEPRHYDQYKIRIGRSLLLGLEVLVAADIVKTIAIEIYFHQPRPSRRIGSGTHLPELDVGA